MRYPIIEILIPMSTMMRQIQIGHNLQKVSGCICFVPNMVFVGLQYPIFEILLLVDSSHILNKMRTKNNG